MMELDFRKKEKYMIKGKGEIRDFNWKNGRGLLHKAEFQECPKDCLKPEHCVTFTWKHLLNGNVGAEVGTAVFYKAFPKGENEAAFAKTLTPVYIGR